MITRTATLTVTLKVQLPDPLVVDVPARGPYSHDSILKAETNRWIARAEKLTEKRATGNARSIGVVSVVCSEG